MLNKEKFSKYATIGVGILILGFSIHAASMAKFTYAADRLRDEIRLEWCSHHNAKDAEAFNQSLAAKEFDKQVEKLKWKFFTPFDTPTDNDIDNLREFASLIPIKEKY